MENLTIPQEVKENELDCVNGVPSVGEFLSGFNYQTYFLVLVPSIFCALTIWMYIKNVQNICKTSSKELKSKCLIICSIYPIVACSSLTSILIPKVYFFCDTISHVSFMLISYQLYRLCLIYIDGESNFIAISKFDTFTYKTPPCCCCCPFGRSRITKDKFKILRFLILQMPIAHVLIFLVLNIIMIENIGTFDKVIYYFIPFIAITVILGIWGFNMTVRMIAPHYTNLRLVGKYFSFQLVLFCCKIQPIFVSLLLKQLLTDCTPPFTIIVKIHSIIQVIVQIGMFLLSLWAHSLYKNPQDRK